MTDHNGREVDDAQLQVPEGLAADLHALGLPTLTVSGEVDARIMAMARAHFAANRRRRTALRWIYAASAAAALLVVALTAGRRFAPAPFDVNSDGRLDILDAFALERSIEAGSKLELRWDVTGDGSVDRRDVDRIALAVVSLKKGATP